MIGMLWFDNNPENPIKEKIRRAAGYYLNKYGELPNICYINPAQVDGVGEQVDGIQIKTSQQTLPNHLWMGIKEVEVEQSR